MILVDEYSSSKVHIHWAAGSEGRTLFGLFLCSPSCLCWLLGVSSILREGRSHFSEYFLEINSWTLPEMCLSVNARSNVPSLCLWVQLCVFMFMHNYINPEDDARCLQSYSTVITNILSFSLILLDWMASKPKNPYVSSFPFLEFLVYCTTTLC